MSAYPLHGPILGRRRITETLAVDDMNDRKRENGGTSCKGIIIPHGCLTDSDFPCKCRVGECNCE